MYQLLKTEQTARRGVFHTVHGDFQTPCFMNVATAGAIKGALSARDLETVNCQVMLCNTYHLHVRPGDGIVRTMGGLQGFTGWKGPTLTSRPFASKTRSSIATFPDRPSLWAASRVR